MGFSLSSTIDFLRRAGKPIAFFWIALFRYRTYQTILLPRGDAIESYKGFIATAFDPQLIVRPKTGRLMPGWYLISYNALSQIEDCLFVPKIYPLSAAEALPRIRAVPTLFGRKKDSVAHLQAQPESRTAPEGGALPLKAHFPGRVSHLVYYDQDPRGFRFDPFDLGFPRTRVANRGWFNLDEFELSRLGLFPLIFFCLRHLLLNKSAPGFIHHVKTAVSLYRHRGKDTALRWMTHRTYRSIQPSISLSAWLDFFYSSNRHSTKYEEPLERQPIFSIVLTERCFKPANYLQALKAISEQSYAGWRLYICDHGISPPKFKTALHNRNIKRVRSLEESKDEIIKSDYVCVLDQSCRLDPDALKKFARAINRHSPDILYADEVFRRGRSGRVFRLNLRPAFDFDHYLSNAFTGLPTVVKSSIVATAVQPWAYQTAGEVSEALVLEALKTSKKVLHIPDILASRWIEPETPTVTRLPAIEIQSIIRRLGFPDAQVISAANQQVRRVRFYSASEKKTAIVIPTKNNGRLLRQAIESIQTTVEKDIYDLVIVDHESDEAETRAYLASLDGIATILDFKGSFNFSKINNFAVKRFKQCYENILFLNNDIEATSAGWLESMRDKISRPDVGIVGAILLYPTEIARLRLGIDQKESSKKAGLGDTQRIQHAGVILGIGLAEHHMKHERFKDAYNDAITIEDNLPSLVTRSFSAVTGACLLIKSQLFSDLGGFDESLKVGFGDVDLCLRAGNLGFKVICDGEAVLTHHESATRDSLGDLDPHLDDSAEFESRYGLDIKLADPFHHPLLVQNNFRYRPIRSPVRVSDPVYRITYNPIYLGQTARGPD